MSGRAAVRSALVPVALRLLRREALREHAVLRTTEQTDPAVLRSRQDARLQALIHWAYDTVPHYKRAMDEAGVTPGAIRGIHDLPRLPLLTRADIKANLSELVSHAADPRDRLRAVTSGTTATPLTFFRDRRTMPFDQASMWQALEWAGVSIADPMAILMLRTSHDGQRRGRWWHRAVGTTYFPVEALYNYDPRLALAVLRRSQPVVLYGYPSLLHILARLVLDAPQRIPLPLRCIFYTAEHMDGDTRALVTEAFRVPIFSRYGCTEFPGAIAQTCAHGRWHVTTEAVAVEVVGGGIGDRAVPPASHGRLLVTDLRSRVMPIIRYEVGDLGSLTDEPCPCGRTGPLLATLDGRAAEWILMPTGRHMPVLVLQRYMRLHMDLVWEYQFQQASPQRLDIVVVPRGPYGPDRQEELRGYLAGVLGPEIEIRVVPRARIPREPSGKRPVLKRLAARSTAEP